MPPYDIVDTWRTVISPQRLALYTLFPIFCLLILAITPPQFMGTRLKQVISFPLMASLLINPFSYRDEINSPFCLFCQMIPVTMFQRFSDIFWIQPWLYKKESYVSIAELNHEIWSSVRKAPKKDAKQPIKDKKFYHLFPSMLLNAIGFDMAIAWVKTFTAKDVYEMEANPSIKYFMFFCAGIMLMTTLFNLVGNMMQLCYSVFVDNGDYAPEEWRNIMEYPLAGTSLEDIWSHRWHKVLRPAWVACAFKPVFFMVRKSTNNSPQGKQLAIALASLSVFLASGIAHEYVALCNTGWSIYKEHFMGQEMLFFGLQGILVIIEKALGMWLKTVLPASFIRSPLVLMARNAYVLSVGLATFPYFINSFADWGFWKFDNLTPIEPLLRQYLIQTPYLRPFCGSLT
ncbi:uncharacterized protein B0P05DRAFT_537687 [Gilbertella persicaria]|uniref:uncharacterized protein n=1 Tax=Gilbertella persicaria TaxID=101096 RepID=UPI00221E481B|nr:uncharacterized protein B0P05DRAFT_537687 [Gilbertella persicaria]KAI8082597.1 hypothetical protein B0P05DRAFT_537687 [Gilbertella persicaria]